MFVRVFGALLALCVGVWAGQADESPVINNLAAVAGPWQATILKEGPQKQVDLWLRFHTQPSQGEERERLSESDISVEVSQPLARPPSMWSYPCRSNVDECWCDGASLFIKSYKGHVPNFQLQLRFDSLEGRWSGTWIEEDRSSEIQFERPHRAPTVPENPLVGWWREERASPETCVHGAQALDGHVIMWMDISTYINRFYAKRSQLSESKPTEE